VTTPRGRFITVEGIDGAGKSTHVGWLARRLEERGHEVVITREPGGTVLGEALRPILLQTPMDAATEALLMFAARYENLGQVIVPALERGAWVISDRFTDATFAYQGAGKGVSEARLRLLEQWVQGQLQPDLTLLFDVDVALARKRLETAREPDKFESENGAFFERVRNGYLQRAAQDPNRVRVISAAESVDDIRKQLEKCLLDV
jgi:dTMP kinase